MADYYTNFSLIMPLPSEAAQKYALDLAEQALHIRLSEEMPDEFPASLRGFVEDWQFDTDPASPQNGPGLWLHSSNGGIDAVCAFIQRLLQRYNPDGSVSLEWSNDCSKPRVDAYGGGAALITAKKVRSINTGQWLQSQIARLNKSIQQRLKKKR